MYNNSNHSSDISNIIIRSFILILNKKIQILNIKKIKIFKTKIKITFSNKLLIYKNERMY